MKKLTTCILLSLLLSLFWCEATFAQASTRMDATHWYFGAGIGLRFIDGEPLLLDDGKVNTVDGSATISDPETGELVLYTDGRTVWNGAHQVISNGTGLLAHESGGQSALIVPVPGNPALYYIFTTGSANAENMATRYSIVDMSRAGGIGAVTMKNVMLMENGTEKIAATRHANGQDYWVVAHEWGNSLFHSFLLTDEGIVDTVTINIGMSIPSPAELQGNMQISPNGEMLATTSNVLKKAELYDFDKSTGVLSNLREIGNGGASYYGLEFSPDNSKLYINTLPEGSAAAHLYQYDLQAGEGDLASIRASRYTLAALTERSWQGGQMQMAPDGRIYVSWYAREAIGVIERPNLRGAEVNYIHDGLVLVDAETSYGIPNFIDADVYGAQVSGVTGTAQSLTLMSIDLYPHPVGDRGTITLSLPSRSRVRGTIHNVQGEQVATLFDEILAEGEHRITCKTDALRTGTYLLRVEDATGGESSRVIVIAH